MIKNLVTIIIPVFNNIEYLRNSLKSAVNQTYRNIEIIVVDDGSGNHDKILKICNNFKKKIKIIKLKKNMGVSVALNKAISVSNGKYINWLSHDDLFCPNKIKEQVKSLAGAVNKISITNSIIWNFEKNVKKKIHLSKLDFKNFFENLLIKDVYNFCTLLVPKNLYHKNYFNKKLRYVQDYDMMIKLSKKVEFVFLDKFLFISRQHNQQTSKTHIKKWIKEKNTFYISYLKNYIEILKNKNSIIEIFTILLFLYNKKLFKFNKRLDLAILKSNKIIIIYMSLVIKFFLNFINVFK
jgi:glycosyltransferase involved in cell wall biosynthesis